MRSEWKHLTVDSLKASDKGSIAIGPFGSRMKSDCYVAEGIPVIRGTNIKEGVSFKGDFVYITKEKADTLGSSNVYLNDLVFPHRGSIGEVGLIQEDKHYVISSSLMKLTCDKQIAYPKYIYYFFKSYLGKHELLKNASQVGTPGIGQPLTSLKKIKVPLPPIPEQKAIAHILGSLDDKIELNRQINKTLESMAQALFKSWFVDFDPVIDNALAAGNPIPEPLQERAAKRVAWISDSAIRERNQTISKQFPSEFEFNEEMGWIPKGWEESCIDKEFNVTMGQSPPGSTYNENGEGIAFFQGRTDFGFRYPSNRIYCTEPKRLACKNDTLVSVRAPVGDVNIALEKCCIGRGISAIRHKSGSQSFTYYSMIELRSHFNKFEAEGTVFGSINQKDFKSLLQLKTDKKIIESFERYAGSLDKKIEINSSAILTLTKLRDTLLPKLLSDEIRIPDAEKLIESL